MSSEYSLFVVKDAFDSDRFRLYCETADGALYTVCGFHADLLEAFFTPEHARRVRHLPPNGSLDITGHQWTTEAR